MTSMSRTSFFFSFLHFGHDPIFDWRVTELFWIRQGLLCVPLFATAVNRSGELRNILRHHPSSVLDLRETFFYSEMKAGRSLIHSFDLNTRASSYSRYYLRSSIPVPMYSRCFWISHLRTNIKCKINLRTLHLRMLYTSKFGTWVY